MSLRRSERLKKQEVRQASMNSQDGERNLNLSLDHSAGQSKSIISLSARRQKIEAQIEMVEKKRALEQKHLDEIQKQKAQILRQEEELLKLQLDLKIAQIEENSVANSSFIHNKSLSVRQEVNGQDLHTFKQIDKDKYSSVQQWINQVELHSFKQEDNKSMSETIPNRSNITLRSARETDLKGEVFDAKTVPKLEQFISRQSLRKELPTFDGNPLDWPNFICQYKNTTEICGFSNEENQNRLQKCLKGKAKEVVQTLLILPQNVSRVIECLEKRFGRPEYIISLLLDKAVKISPVKEDKLITLIDFSDSVKNLVNTLETLDEENYLQNPILLKELVEKLPVSYRMQWMEHIQNCNILKYNKLNAFQQWLERKSEAACQLQIVKPSEVSKSRKELTLTTVQERLCSLCKMAYHNLSKCLTFKSSEVNERWKCIKSEHVCISCLGYGHGIKKCKYRKNCGINGCHRPHHQLLHKDENVNDRHSEILNTSSQVDTNCHILQSSTNILLKIIPVRLSSQKGNINTYALLDDASTVTLLDQEISDQLRLKGPNCPLHLQWTNETTSQEENSTVVSVLISGINNMKQFQLRHVRTTRNLSLPTQSIDMDKLSQQYPYITNMPQLTMNNVKPKLLIGQDNWPLLVTRRIINGPWNGPALSKTLLGWVLHGNTNKLGNNYVNIVCTTHSYEKDDIDLLHEMVKQQWKLEDMGAKGVSNTSMSREDLRAQSILDSTAKRIGDRFEIGLLWKSETIKLPESKQNAFKRLRYIEKKMDKDPLYANVYCNKMDEYIKKNYLRKLTKEEAATLSPKTWYLPHFGVINQNKPNKIRIVFDAAAKSNGVSLNDNLLTGPDLYNSLTTILLNFRIKNVAFVADIKEMFLQVRVRKEDCCAQRLLWRGMNRNNEADTYEVQVVFFGSVCGPCLAQDIKNRNAKEHLETYPEAVLAILNQHYMDDYLGGANSEEEAIQLINDVIAVHKKAGFVICNWICNSKRVLKNMEPSLVGVSEKNMDIDNTLPTERILGLWWSPEEDYFSFQTKFHKIDKEILTGERRPTKREILKVVMSIFDPLGFVANFIIHGKILLQDIWRSGLGWDDEITSDQNIKWNMWLNDLKNIYKMKIRRQYTISRNNTYDLHIFCDASEVAYASVVYLQWKEDEQFKTSFVIAKTRVAPLKPMSIPRLELQAALMGARLGNYIVKELQLNLNSTFYWTDSKTVLHWIKSESKRYKMFVSQRLGEIQELTNSDDWFYVSSKLNVADEATKRLGQVLFSNDSRWMKGPAFLQGSIEEWPTNVYNFTINNEDPEDMELKNNIVATIREKPQLQTPDAERFSKWTRLLRTTAWMLRFITVIIDSGKNNRISYELTTNEIARAEIVLLRRIQADAFHSELTLLQNGKTITKSSRLYRLCPSLDENNLIRLNGRLDNALQLSHNTKRPVILDSNHSYTKLLIHYHHELMNHIGTETVINNLRQKYWIIGLRQAVKQVAYKCQLCKNRKVKPVIPIMGQLPLCRLEPTTRPFIKTGLDYFGPLEVTVKRSHEKRYGVIFTCMVTRAVHIDIANDLSSNSFIHVYRQFGCRRGFPEEIFCDNGTNFKGAESELREELQNWNHDDITRNLTMKNTKWHFNPPIAPHMGGAWERLIQIIKRNLKQILKDRYPQEYVLRTFLVECENIINSRPLTRVPLDYEDADPLTPNHFLIGASYNSLACSTTDQKDLNLMTKWRAAQRLTDIFWKRWTKEYLPTLTNRSKWHEETQPIKIGDIVLIVDPNGQRNTWPKGKIVEIYADKVGNIRVADVQTVTGIYRRPVSKLAVLDVKSNSTDV